MYRNTVQSLNNNDWKLFELQITLSKYCLAGTDGRTDVRTEKAIPRPASAFGDASKNTVELNYLVLYGYLEIHI
jgi:hypothetical protein